MGPEKGDIIFELRTLDRQIGKRIDSMMRQVDDDESMTRVQHWIIGYLYRNTDIDVFQKDIESEFHVSRSTTSNTLTLMEKKGYIERLSMKQDARLKKIVLTEKAIELHESHMHKLKEMDRFVEGALTAEEKNELIRIIYKIRAAVTGSNEDLDTKD